MAANTGVPGSEQRYGPTSGTLAGWFGLVMCAGIAIAFVVTDTGLVSVRWALVFVTFGVVIWAMMLRPLIVVRDGEVVLRNPFASWHIPISLITSVTVRAVTFVETPGKTYSSPAVGRRLRRMDRRGLDKQTGLRGFGNPFNQIAVEPVAGAGTRVDASTPEGLADLMIAQIKTAAAEGQRVAALRGGEPEKVARVWAVPELVLLGAALVALGITLAL
jgi:hypothetical protein